jgi:hypothetical protein
LTIGLSDRKKVRVVEPQAISKLLSAGTCEGHSRAEALSCRRWKEDD